MKTTIKKMFSVMLAIITVFTLFDSSICKISATENTVTPVEYINFNIDFSKFVGLNENSTYRDLLQALIEAAGREVDDFSNKIEWEDAALLFEYDGNVYEYYFCDSENSNPVYDMKIDMSMPIKFEYYVQEFAEGASPFDGLFIEGGSFDKSDLTITFNGEEIDYGVYPADWDGALAGTEKITVEPYYEYNNAYFYINLGTIEEVIDAGRSHVWEYSADNNELIAKCKGAAGGCTMKNCDYCSDENAIKLTLTATSTDYTGNRITYSDEGTDTDIVLSGKTAWTEAGFELPEVYYVGTGSTNYTSSTTRPTNAGTYTASISMGEAIAKANFEIKKISQSVAVDVEDYTYNSTVSTPEISGTIMESATVTYFYNTINSNEGGQNWSGLTADTLLPNTYYIYAVLQETANYKETKTPAVAFDVKEANVTNTAYTENNYSGVYDGESHSATVSVSAELEGAEITYSESLDGTYVTTPISSVNVCNKTIYYKIKKSGYETITGSITLQITAKPVSITALDNEKHIGEEDPTFETKIEGLITGENLNGLEIKREEGEIPGNYDIYPSLDADANTNYAITKYNGKFTINDHSWSEYVDDNNITTETNGSKTRICEKCKEEDVYVISNSKLNLTTTSHLIDKKELSQGQIFTSGNIHENVPVTVIDFSAEDFAGLLTDSEIEKIENSSEIKFFLEVINIDDIDSSEDKNIIQDYLTNFEGNATIINCFDFSLFKRIDNGEISTRITDIGNNKIKISISIPEEMLNKDTSLKRSFYIVRVHDGVAETLEATYNEATHSIEFETDKFSTYSLVYSDENVKPVESEEPSKDNNSNNDSKDNVEAVEDVMTGYSDNWQWFTVLGFFGTCAVIALVEERKVKKSK